MNYLIILTTLLLLGCNQAKHNPIFECKDFDCSVQGNSNELGTNQQTEKLSFVEVLEQGYWYSRYNLSSLVMKSGLGETFMPNPKMVPMLIQMVSDKKSKAILPENLAFLKRVYNQGNPQFANKNNGKKMDFKNFRWIKNTKEEEKTTLNAFAWTLMKEVEWSKLFNIDAHFGVPKNNDVPGAQQRLAGLGLCIQSIVQTDLFIKDYNSNKEKFDYSSNSGMFVAFSAISDLADFINTKNNLPSMSNNRCAKVASMMKKKSATEVAADYLSFLEDLDIDLPEAVTIKEKALLIQGYSFYAKALKDKEVFTENALESVNQLISLKPKNIIEQSYSIRAFVTAYRITKEKKYIKEAAKHWKKLFKDYDKTNNKFKSMNKYSTNDIAVLISAVNSLKLYAGKEVTQRNVLRVFIPFFKTIMNQAKLQISAPPVTMIASWERKANSEFHRAPSLPVPFKAGGKYGTAPVFAKSVEFGKDNQWKNDTSSYDTAGAMNLANQLIWFHSSEVEGIPCPDNDCIAANDIDPDDLQPPKKPTTGKPSNGNGNPSAPVLTFNQLHKKILTRCVGCHAGSGAPHGLDMSTPDKAYKNLVGVSSVEGRNFGGVKRVTPGDSDPSKSYIIAKLQKPKTSRIGARMPFGGPYLKDSEIALVKAWINDGARR